MLLKFESTNGENRGYISYLTWIGQLDTIKISATDTRDPLSGTNYNKEYAIDGNPNTRYGSIPCDTFGQYFEIQFKLPITITAYSLIYINTVDSSPSYPRYWNLTASNDPKIGYDIIDTQTDSHILSDKKSHIFEIESQKQKSYSYLRIINTGPNGNSGTNLHISEIEFFGIVKPRSHTCHRGLTFLSQLHLFLFITIAQS